ncbi:MAG: very short patch repair endonuclease [Candidatus Magasanikbacteria bacterium]|nr:very short patch repair endonuclease [Candidatus Magasanikbacteria bacterium]
MADVFSKKKRSEIMSRIKSKETGIERTVFSYLRKHNIYFQRHYSKVAGKPDIALPSQKKAVFINGDFWHGYKFRIWRNRIPRKYWIAKIESNIKRDKRNCRALKRRGWKIMNIWGHQVLEDKDKTCQLIAIFLAKTKRKIS